MRAQLEHRAGLGAAAGAVAGACARSLASLTGRGARRRPASAPTGERAAVVDRLATELEHAQRGLSTRRMLVARAAVHDPRLEEPTIDLARRTLAELEHREAKRSARARSLDARIDALEREIDDRRAHWASVDVELASAQRVFDDELARAGLAPSADGEPETEPGDVHGVVPPAELRAAAERLRRQRTLRAAQAERELAALAERLGEGRELAERERHAVLAVARERHALFRSLGEYLDVARPAGLGARLAGVDEQHRLIAKLTGETAAVRDKALRRRLGSLGLWLAAGGLALALAAMVLGVV